MLLVNTIFSSIQGEGVYIGYKQLFLRLSACNLACDYCDENNSGGQELSNESIIKELETLNSSYHHSLSLTGGEPLLQVNELIKLLPLLKIDKYLETNSTLPANLGEIKHLISIFSLDFKPGYEKEFQQSLELVKNEDTFIKFILHPKQNYTDLKNALDIIQVINKDIPFILQPVTPHRNIKSMPPGQEIISAYNIAKKKLNDVRVIPQAHKFMHLT